MKKILEIIKLLVKVFTGILILVFFTLILFLYNPDFFIEDIENITSELINSGFKSNIDISLKDIDGDFVGGFYIKDIRLLYNSTLLARADSIYINPNISDLFFLNISFSNISIIKPIFNEKNIELNKPQSFESKKIFSHIRNKLPIKYIVDQFYIDNGIVFITDKSYFVNTKSNIIYDNNLSLNNLNLKINDSSSNLLEVSDGILNYKNDLLSINFQNLKLQDIETSIKLSYDFNRYSLQEFDGYLRNINNMKLGSFDDLKFKLVESEHDFIKFKNSTIINSNLLNYYLSIKKISDKNFYRFNLSTIDNDFISFNSNFDVYKINNDYSLKINFEHIRYQNHHISDLDVKCDLEIGNSFSCDINSIVSAKIDSIYIDNITGKLELKNKLLNLKNFKISSNFGNGIINNATFSDSLNFLDANIFLTSLDSLFSIYFKKYDIKGKTLNAEIYYDDSENFKLSNININTKLLKINDLDIDSLKTTLTLHGDSLYYKSIFYKPKHPLISLDKLSLDGHLFNDIFFNTIEGENVKTGESIVAKFRINNDNELVINQFNSKLKDVLVSVDNIKLKKENGLIKSNLSTINLGDGKLLSEISYLDNSNFSINASFADINIHELKKIFQLNDRINGLINGQVSFSMQNNIPLLLSDINVNNGYFDDILFKDFSGQLIFRENRLTIPNILVKTDIGSLDFNGWFTTSDKLFDFKNNDSLNIDCKFDKFQLSFLTRYFPWEHSTSGLLSGTMKAKGKFSSPRIEINSNVESPAFDKIYGDRLNGSLIYKNNRLYFKGLNLKTINGDYTGTGSMPIQNSFTKLTDINSKDDNIDFIFTGKSKSMEFLTPYLNGVGSINGDFSYQLGLSGSIKSPIRSGQISVQNASLDFIELSNPLTEINGIATINNNKLVIKNLNAKLNQNNRNFDFITSSIMFAKSLFTKDDKITTDSKIDINGSIDLSSFFKPDYSLIIDCENLYLNTTNGKFDGIADANLFISGRDTLTVDGELRPKANNFTINNLFDSYSIENVGNTKEKYIDYDIYMPFQDGIMVNTDDINMFIEGDLTLTTSITNDFEYSGKINIMDGSFNYNSNEFSEAKGQLIIDPSKSSPYAEVNAQTQLGDESIDVTFIGFLDNPNLILESSSQEYSQSDILRLLTFKDSNIMDDYTTTGQIGEILANYMETEIEKNVSLYTDIDEFKLNRSGSIADGLEDANVNIYLGKRLSSNLYLNTRINLNQNDKNNEYEVSYRLNNNISIVARVDEHQYWHINYRYKYKY